ncbi:hypothetical protein [Desulfosarcina ovata]|uniref:Uncharacterized protein n=2 Tax=Desulfosarcina ovata TaxID=83564 RepID=A0A5K8A696_9BACT|nr:hypothetical protein [Desulfosarcina ovata]BBO80692.1 hypothetical protein DSCO28_12580 [Desulfosarcina ovata subsp. sediminis]BBO87904.1 hypothetical protein DSCOOX_10840 [Desulfosarcina ovata subsp. ovata]
MDERLTRTELESRWENAMTATRATATSHPGTYRLLKTLAADIVTHPVDIDDYFPTVENLLDLLKRLDPVGRGSIFHIFSQRITPTSIWQVRMLRMECKDLLAHLDAFDQWRRDQHRLWRVK